MRPSHGEEPERHPPPPGPVEAQITRVTGRRAAGGQRGTPAIDDLSLEVADGSTLDFGARDGRESDTMDHVSFIRRMSFLRQPGSEPWCPICLDSASLTDEHVPQHNLGGSVMTTTCAPCNNNLGSRTEVDLQHWFDHAYFATLADARIHVATHGAHIKADRTAGRAITGRDRMTVNTLCDRSLTSREGEVREVTRETYGHALKPVRRHLGSRQVQTLTHADVHELRQWLTREGGRNGQGLGAHAAKASLTAFKSVLDHAVRVERVVAENVARGVKPPTVNDGQGTRLERWTATDLLRFTEHADGDPLGAAWRLATLGLRREEVLGLTWDAVDFEAGTLTIRQTRVAVSASTDPRRWMLGAPKSAASRRTIRPDQVQPGTMAALRRLKMAAQVDPRANPADLVVVDPIGRPVVPKWFSDRFAALAREARVPVIHLHSCRHTVAYLLHEAGVPVVRAAAFLGHTPAVHMAVYLFAREGDVDSAGAALGDALRAAAGS